MVSKERVQFPLDLIEAYLKILFRHYLHRMSDWEFSVPPYNFSILKLSFFSKRLHFRSR